MNVVTGKKPFQISQNSLDFLSVPHNMSMVVQKRLVADPSLGIMDIQKVILSHFNVCKDFDLFSVLDCPGHQKWSWKTAPNVAWMSKTAEFVCSVLKIAPNGVLASQKVKGALLKLTQTSNKFNRTRYCDTDWADHCDLRLRTVLSQYREVKKRSDTYACAMRKASEEEKIAIDKALALLRLDYGEHPGTEEGSNQQLQLVPYSRAPEAASGSSLSQALVPTSCEAASSSRPSGGMQIWQRILQKRDSSPSPPLPAEQSQKASLDSKPRSSLGFQNQMIGPLCVPAEECTASEASTPVQKKRTKFQEGKKTNVAEFQEGKTTNVVKKGKGKAFPADFGLDEEDENILEECLGQQISMEKQKQVRRTKKKTKTSASKKKPAKKKSLEEKKTEKVKDQQGNKQKSSFRHRQTSTAYHSARLRAKHQGYSPESCKRLGRTAAQKVAADINSGLLTEPVDVD